MQNFTDWLAAHAQGSLDRDIATVLNEVTKEVTGLRKKGSLVIEITIEPTGQSGKTVAVGGKVTAKGPRPDAELRVYYPDLAGELHRDDPYQMRMTDQEAEQEEPQP